MAEKTIVFASDDDLIKGAIGQVTNEKDIDMRYENPQPVKGGIYDTQIFGTVKKCTCRLVTHGRCPQCNVIVYDDEQYAKNYAYYQMHTPFIIRIKLTSLLDKFSRIGLVLPKVKARPTAAQQDSEKTVKVQGNRDPLVNLWSLSFEVVPDGELEKQLDDVVNSMASPRILLDSYELTGKDGKAYKLNIYELDMHTDINTVGPIGLRTLTWYSFKGKSLEFINEHVNSILPLISPGLRKYNLRDIGGRINKEIPEISLEYKRIIWADQYIQHANEDLIENSIDKATLCFLLNDLYDKHISQADMLQTSKEATFRKNVGTRLGGSMRGNAMSYLGAKLGEVYLPRALAYHALQKQIIDKIVDDYQREGYDALKMYIKMDPIAIECFEWVVDHSQVFMNRNPSLHRNNILQFTPKLWQDDTPAIGVNPYVCSSYNLDNNFKYLRNIIVQLKPCELLENLM
ncbi:MAG: hypothetical protein MJZ34_03220 [Paludibacteraceae bacterium]|nr:hypothetical protein [Paludibacteraceae bacterium]